MSAVHAKCCTQITHVCICITTNNKTLSSHFFPVCIHSAPCDLRPLYLTIPCILRPDISDTTRIFSV